MITNVHTALSISKKSSKVLPAGEEMKLTPEEKRDCIQQSPRFGMWGMMNYMLHKEGGKECSHVFGRQFLLPMFIFVAQWLMFISLVMFNLKNEIKCSNSPIEQKLLMASISMVYFVHSFFVYDEIRDRNKFPKVPCSSSVIVALDTFQEHTFTLFVHVANLWIVFISDDLLDALFNSLALEFLMNLDNEYERLYFKYSISEAEYIYDNIFVTKEQSHKNTEERCRESAAFKCFKLFTYVPYKILSLGFIVLPIYCATMLVFGIMCK
jgi:hypothetical protein